MKGYLFIAFVFVAVVSFAGGVFVGAQRGQNELSQTPTADGDAENAPAQAPSSNPSNAAASTLGFAATNFTTFWVSDVPASDSSFTICVPAVSFKITNNGSSSLSGIDFNASFVNDSAKTAFGNGEVFWDNSTGHPDLPPGYSATILISSTNGLYAASTGSCPASLPSLSGSLTYQNTSLADGDHPFFAGAINAVVKYYYGFAKFDASNLGGSHSQ